jgi:hypothetical protein
MKEYTDKKVLIAIFEKIAKEDENNYFHLDELTQEIFDAPAADVVERKRGEWKYIGGDEWCCSCCGFVASTEGRWEPMMAKFCEECGADMREVDHA